MVYSDSYYFNEKHKMKTFFAILLSTIFSLNIGSAQSPIKLSTSLGTFYIKYMGTGNWNWALNQCAVDGYRLPNSKEIYKIMMETKISSPFFSELHKQGYNVNETSIKWFWTSEDYNPNFSDLANQTKTLALRYGLTYLEMNSPYVEKVSNGDFFLSDRNSYGHILVLYKEGEKKQTSTNNNKSGNNSSSTPSPNQSKPSSENKPSEKIPNKSNGTNEPILKPVSIESYDLTSLTSNVYKFYLQKGKKSLKYEWVNANSASPNPTKPSDLLPSGMNYFEFSISDKMIFSNGSTEFYYILNKKFEKKELPESERYHITELSTDSMLLKEGKFKIALSYVYPPKSKWRTKVFYVYCDELKNDLLQLGIK